MQACPRCQTENRDDARSCTKCGASLGRTNFGRRVTPPGQNVAAGGSGVPSSSSTRTCPSCGQATPATTQFCSACGSALSSRALGGVEYASFGRRLGGYLIDVGLLVVIDVISVFVIATVWSNLFSFVISFSYFVLLNANGGTWGKRILGMRLESRETGENIGVGRAVVRYVVAIVSGLALLIGYLWCIWDANKQTWHDKAAGSVVVRT